MNVQILIMLFALSYVVLACGGSSGDSHVTESVVSPATVNDFKGVKLTLADRFSGNRVESDYYFYSNGDANFIVRSIG